MESTALDNAKESIADSVTLNAKQDSTTAAAGANPRQAENGLVYSRFQFLMLFVGLSRSSFRRPSLDWVVSWGTAFFLASIPLIPTYDPISPGKLADVFGRKPVFMAGIFIFELGSLICRIAPNLNTLLVGRAVAGLGGGYIIPMTLVIIAAVVSLRDRPRYQGLNGACFSVASVVGPSTSRQRPVNPYIAQLTQDSLTVGGAFTDHLSWRWCFNINLPFGGLAMLAVCLFLRLSPITGNMKEKLAHADYTGTSWLAAGTVVLVYALSAGGVDYEWNSASIISMFALSAVSFVVIALVEINLIKTPLIPFELYKNRFVLACWGCAFCVGFCFLSLSYIPIYFQVVNGTRQPWLVSTLFLSS
ncbi:MFS general substrate transporter [Gonapodya prolifera JEL478]|uniref:MFS general substrate transporter n=1 Tax=Gonapodya prolifera (strain JEL478) TaxID=1344416 RepID=A0A139A3W0_GONPJ|nr:MFS general substrate transporter [Gonapodya prolifera JEL478]|eukprot:KXS11359.1 MFS general substrate transporter [Gonapodya prolifera JEL478]